MLRILMVEYFRTLSTLLNVTPSYSYTSGCTTNIAKGRLAHSARRYAAFTSKGYGGWGGVINLFQFLFPTLDVKRSRLKLGFLTLECV